MQLKSYTTAARESEAPPERSAKIQYVVFELLHDQSEGLTVRQLSA